jgi:hypothetical protein
MLTGKHTQILMLLLQVDAHMLDAAIAMVMAQGI